MFFLKHKKKLKFYNIFFDQEFYNFFLTINFYLNIKKNLNFIIFFLTIK